MEVSSLSLRETLGPVSFVSAGDVVASSFCCDSRNLRPGEVFVAVPGKSHDGHGFIEAAVSAGASAVMVERPHARINIPQCVVPDIRAAFAKICLAQLGNPHRNVTVAGVTGTNGKTTSTWLLRAVLESAGRTTGLLGTIEYSNGRTRSAAALTTPAPPQIAHLFADMAKQRASHCVMEISSHALDQRRCAALPLAVAAITNVTRDHFDYHGDVRNYRTAKSRIADLLQPGAPLLIGVDDPGCRAVLDLLPSGINVTTFGLTENAQTRVELTSANSGSQTLKMHLKSGTVELITSLVGRHNALNLLTAAAMAEQLGVDLPIIADSLSAVTEIPGRMERIDLGQPFTVLVDYAHTPDGITHCLATARTLSRGRVILVFGAGGDRDRDKRPLMAEAATSADQIIVTSDNPRSESPSKIIDEICQGFVSLEHVQTCIDRNMAIQRAVSLAQPGDVVIIAGRGHESIQQIGTRSISFDDRKVARRILRELQNVQSDSNHRIPNAVPA